MLLILEKQVFDDDVLGETDINSADLNSRVQLALQVAYCLAPEDILDWPGLNKQYNGNQ